MRMNNLFQVPSYYSGIFGQSQIDGMLYTQSDEFVCDCLVIFREQESFITFGNFDNFIKTHKQSDNTVMFKTSDFERVYYKIKFNIVIEGVGLSVVVPKILINSDISFSLSNGRSRIPDVTSSFKILENADMNLIEFNSK
jgi:hypothetical protein